MIYAAIIVCHMGGCVALTDDHSPHDTQADCLARLDEMRTVAAQAFASAPGARMRATCAPLDDVRAVIPGAFPGHVAEVLL